MAKLGIDKEKKPPLYEQLKLAIQDKILMGELGPGVLLPSEKQLCEQYNVSRVTVRHALDELERKGLIKTIKGKGSIVNKIEPTISNVEICGYTKLVESRGFKASSKILRTDLVEDNEELLSLFHFSDEEERKFWHIARLRYLNDKPAVLMNHYIKKSLGDKMMMYDLEKYSFYYLYELLSNRKLMDEDTLIKPIQASQEMAQFLEIEFGSIVVWSRAIAYFEDRTPAEVNISFYSGENFLFRSKSFLPMRSRNEELQVESLSPINSDPSRRFDNM